MKPFSYFFFWSRWRKPGGKFTFPWRVASRPSCNTETNGSTTSAKPRARPSFFLRGFFLCLAMAAWTAHRPEEGAEDKRAALLVAKGWRPAESTPCANLRPGTFYELSAEEGTAELFVTSEGQLLTSSGTWPEEPRECREIPQANYVEEI